MFYVSNTAAVVKSATRINATRALEDMMRAAPHLVTTIRTVGCGMDGNVESFQMIDGKIQPAYGAECGAKVAA